MYLLQTKFLSITLISYNIVYFFFFFLEFNYYEVLSLLFFTYMIGSSILLLKGLKENLQVLLLPWIFGMEFIIFSLLIWSIWLLKKYYTYVSHFYICVY